MRDIELLPQLPEELSHFVAVLLGVFALAAGLALDIQAVLVKTRQEEGVVPLQATIARLHVTADSTKGRADVGLGIGVVNGCCEIVRTHESKTRKRKKC